MPQELDVPSRAAPADGAPPATPRWVWLVLGLGGLLLVALVVSHLLGGMRVSHA